MASSLLHGRLCILIAVIILLFLPLSFTGNNNSNNALAQTPHCDAVNNYAIYDPEWCWYERDVENYPWCVQAWTKYNEHAASISPHMQVDISEQCQLPPPPAPLHPLDCSQLNTCPEPCADVVPTTLNFHDSYDESGILFVDYVYVQDLPTGGHDSCADNPHVHTGKCFLGQALDKSGTCQPIPKLMKELCVYGEKQKPSYQNTLFYWRAGGVILGGGFGALGFLVSGPFGGVTTGIGAEIGWGTGEHVYDWLISRNCGNVFLPEFDILP